MLVFGHIAMRIYKDFQEYDMSDCKYIIKITRDLSKEDLEMLFPDQKKKIKNAD